MKNRVLRTLALAVALTGVAAAAGARRPSSRRGRFVDEPYGFSYDCGFPVEVTGVASGNFRLREGTGDDATAFFSLDRISFREIHTNPQTGEWFSVSGHFANNEVGAHPRRGVAVRVPDHQGRPGRRDRGLRRQPRVEGPRRHAAARSCSTPAATRNRAARSSTSSTCRLAGPHASFGRRCDVASELIG